MSGVMTCEKAQESCFLYGYEPPEALKQQQTHGCFKDRDHIVPRRVVIVEPQTPADWIHNDYILRSPNNIRWVCRQEHHQRNIIEQREDRLLFPVPTLAFMLRTLRQNIEDGLINETTDKVTAQPRTPEQILDDIDALGPITDDELIYRAAEHVFAARQSA